MTQTYQLTALAPIPPGVDLRTERANECNGMAGWLVTFGTGWVDCDGCSGCLPQTFKAPPPLLAESAQRSLARAMAATAAADQPF